MYDVFISENGEFGRLYKRYDDLSLAHAHAAALFVSGAYARVTLYHVDTVLKSWGG
jgi:hypothetical protein